MISIIIPVYNSEKTIERLLESIFRSSYKKFEVIIVDAESTDLTLEIVKGFQVRIITHTNAGPGKARNLGVKNANYDRVMFFDSDVVVFKDTIEMAIEAMNRTGADVVNGHYSVEPTNKGLFPLYKCLMDQHIYTQGDLGNYPVFEAKCCLTKKRVFLETGGYNEKFTFQVPTENEEFGFRISPKFKMILDPNIIVKHQFPGFWKLCSVYFWRTFWWMKFFLHKRKSFTPSCSTTLGMAIGTLSATATLILLGASISFPPAISGAAVALILYLFYLRGFFRIVIRTHPSLLPIFIPINIFFSCITTMGACCSLIDSAVRKLAGNDYHERLFSDS
ncbi:MAG: glycosyltransferase [Candidatus Undinarchaeales archaeon]|nr:glycosyltransferase [Candidatus Undinarchaeales archaeon]MDP7491447.1 glycosyltransferase [Candidatus Undinarchaeales archaeon]